MKLSCLLNNEILRRGKENQKLLRRFCCNPTSSISLFSYRLNKSFHWSSELAGEGGAGEVGAGEGGAGEGGAGDAAVFGVFGTV